MEARDTSVAVKFFEMLEELNKSSFIAFNCSIAWLLVEPHLRGVTEMYTEDLYNKYGDSFAAAGLDRNRIYTMMINALFNLYYQTLGATETFVQI